MKKKHASAASFGWRYGTSLGAGSLAEHAALAELNANIRLEPGKHELTAEEIGGGQLYGVREPVQSLCPPPGCLDPA